MRTFLHGFDKAADAFAHLIFFRGNAFFVRHHRLELAEIHYDIRAVEPTHGSANDVTHAVFVFGENLRLLGLTNFLHQRLLGVLRGHATKAGGCHFLLNFIAHLRVSLDAARIEHGNLVVLGNDLLGHDKFGESFDIAVLGIHDHAELARGADGLLGRLQQRFFDRRHEQFTADAFFAFPKFQSGNKISVHNTFRGATAPVLANKKVGKTCVSDFRTLVNQPNSALVSGS